MKTTIRDVAEAAGVSAMTVSTVLHGSGRNVRVGAETAAKIRDVAKELHYQPNTIARSLRSRKTNVVGVVLQHFNRIPDDNPYYPQLLNGIMAALFKENYTLALCPTLVRGDELGSIWDGRFDGVLWARPDFTEASVARLRQSALPLVMMHTPPASASGVSTFTADNDAALRLVVDHLSHLGHRNITFVVDDVNEHTAEGRARAEAFLKAAAERGNIEARVWIWDESSASISAYLETHPECTAMACFSDVIAGRMLIACQIHGIEVPGRLSVVGFDSSSFCERTVPRLTSVHQDVEQIAYSATTHLLSLIRREPSSDRPAIISSLYECGLDVRDSTSPPSTLKNSNEIL